MKYLSILCLVVLLVAALAACAGNEPEAKAEIESALDAYSNKDFISALSKLRPLAEGGNPEAQYWLGEMYSFGDGITLDEQTALSWQKKALKQFRELAEQGNATAQYYLGMMYQLGRILPEYPQKAVLWYEKAAEQGHADAQFTLGLLYKEIPSFRKRKLIPPRNNKTSFYWTRKAASQGHVMAMAELGSSYRFGTGVQKDYIEAFKWYSLAVSNGDNFAKKNLDELALEMTPAQIEEAKRMAREWKHKKGM